MKPYPLQVSDDELNMTERHLDGVELVKDLVEPLEGWLDCETAFCSCNRLLIFCYVIHEKFDGGSEFVVSWSTELP